METNQESINNQDVTPSTGSAAPLQSAISHLECASVHIHEKEMWEKIMSFEDDAYNPNSKGFKTGFPELDEALEGIQPGFHIVAGDSNHGKSSLISQLAWQIAANNSNAYVMDFSLDDPLRDKLPRIVASKNKTLINAVKNPIKYAQFPKMMERRERGMKDLLTMVDKYKVYDSSFSTDIDLIEQEIKRHKIELNAAGIDKRIVVFIDNFHDLTTSVSAGNSEKSKYDYLAQRVADMAIELDIPIICTAEFRKLNGFRRPGVDDIRESTKIKYEAKSIILVYNEVSVKGEASDLFYQIGGKPLKQPVMEVRVAKNKYTSFKGTLFYYFFPEMAYFQSATPQDTKTFTNLLFTNS